jgi:repressor LexA
MTIKEFGKRLREAREERNLTVKELGELMDTSGATISRYENGVHEPKREIVKKIADVLGVSAAWLMGAPVEKYGTTQNSDGRWKKVPLVGTVAAGQPILAVENFEDEIYTDDNVDFCLTVKGDSMINARIADGDIVFVKMQSDINSGDIAVVIIDNEEATVKRVIKSRSAIVLQPENKDYSPQIFTGRERKEVRIIGKVISVKIKVR